MREDLESLKHRLPLLEYLQRHNWTAHPAGTAQEFFGLCPLHEESRPSFYVNARKNLFYCHGCGRGGDLIRFIELFRNLSFRQSVVHLREEVTPASDFEVLGQALAFYQLQLHRFPEAAEYLEQRGLRDPRCVEELEIGYAPGGNLRRYLGSLDCPSEQLFELGLLSRRGGDTFYRRVIFPCRQDGQIVNIYGRSIGTAFPHRLLPRSKGGCVRYSGLAPLRYSELAPPSVVVCPDRDGKVQYRDAVLIDMSGRFAGR